MSNSMPGMSSFATYKRSACDRCRSQKLRCPPLEPDATSCPRCLRLGAECITSYPRPSGRAAKTGDSAATSRQPPRNLQPEPEPSRDVITVSGQVAIAPSGSQPTTTATNTSKQTHATTSDAQSHSDATLFDPGSFPLLGNGQDVFKHTAAMFTDNLMFLAPDASHVDHLDDAFFSMDSSTFATSHADNVDVSEAATPQTGDSPDDNSYDEYLENDTRLSSLMLDLSRRLELCMEMARSPDTVMLDVALTPAAAGAAGHNATPGSNLLANALGDLSEFLCIIQPYASRRTGPPSDFSDSSVSTGSNGDLTKTGFRIGTVVLLNLLSAYLQIVAIYDVLLQCVSEQLVEGSNGPASDPRGALRGLPLAGLSRQQGNLQTTILVHAILNQFDNIETLLGLPAEFRVTDKHGSYSGLFEDDRGTGLLAAVSLSVPNARLQPLLPADHRLERRALPSLKQTIRNIQALLRR